MNKDRFLALVEQIPSKRVLVVGDFILDEYLVGDTERVSREAPVVVIDYRESVFHPGGAANAVQNVSSLGARAGAFGVLGEDRHGNILKEILQTGGASTEGLIQSKSVLTAVKTRILAGELHAQKQQVARIDRSHRVEPDADIVKEIGRRVVGSVAESDAVLISDYGMGVVPGPVSESLIDVCRKERVPVIVDSRSQLLRFVGATVATPNEVELFEAMRARPNDKPNLPLLAKDAVSKANLGGLVITRGSRGMLAYNADGSFEYIGIVGTRDITDVTGAGDTVSAMVSLSLASGATLAEAAEMATYAASVVVMKRGTATVTLDELTAVRDKHPRPMATGPEHQGFESPGAEHRGRGGGEPSTKERSRDEE